MPLPSLYYLERYRNKGTRTYSQHSTVNEAIADFQPESKVDQVHLVTFKLPKSATNLYTANPSPALKSRFIDGEDVQFYVHPQVIQQCADDPYLAPVLKAPLPQTKIPAIVSSSTRTLFAADSQAPHAIKVHFPFKVSRYTRKMRDEVVEQAVRVSEELEQGISKMPDDFAFLREVIGITFKETDANHDRPENWGFVVRDMKPFPEINEPRSLVPGFALYGEDVHQDNQKPLLTELIGAAEPVSFMLNKLLFPIMHHWIDAFRHFGFLLEPHGQNVLLEVDNQNQIKRIVHRDLSVGIDRPHRHNIGLNSRKLNGYNQMDHKEFQSITFDMFMGSHFFDRLVQCASEYYPGVTEADFTVACRDEFVRYFPDYQKHFPETIWYYSEKRDQFNKPLNEDTGCRPKWRP